MKQYSIIGGILLIVGTAIGAGILALPLVTNLLGFYPALAIFACVWLLSTASAFLLLEVNMSMPADSNLISMAKATLGRTGAAITWFLYLLLLYAVIAAYLAGGGQLLQPYLKILHHNGASQLASLSIAIIFAIVVSWGIHVVDLTNRILMIVKLGSFALLLYIVLPHTQAHLLSVTNASIYKGIIPALAPIVASFSFAMIIPSLRSYYQNNSRKLCWLLGIGSLIPLTCYALWNMAVLGTLPSSGPNGLQQMAQSGQGVRLMAQALGSSLHDFFINSTVHTFTTICMGTSLLALALACSDFLSDGLGWPKVGWKKLGIMLLTFTPPLVLAVLIPNAFIYALDYAGIWCCFLFFFLPVAMAYSNRYLQQRPTAWRVPITKSSLILLAVINISLLVTLLILQVKISL